MNPVEVPLPSSCERVAVTADGTVLAQSGGTIGVVDREVRWLRPLLEQRSGEQLACAFGEGSVLVLDAQGRLVSLDPRGDAGDSAGELPGEPEFVDARPLPGGKGALLLLAERVPEPGGLGRARFRFVAIGSSGTRTVEIEGSWSSVPRFWTLDPGGKRLFAPSEEDPGAVAEFDLASGRPAAERRWVAFDRREGRLAGLELLASGARAVLAWQEEDGAPLEILLSEGPEHAPAPVARLEGPTLAPPDLVGSPGGKQCLVRQGEGRTVRLRELELSDGSVRDLGTVGRLDPALWCDGGRTVVMASDSRLRFVPSGG